MAQHVIFVAPFAMDTTLRFIAGAAGLEGVDLTVLSQEPLERLPAELRARLAGHWRVDDALDPRQLVNGARALEARHGRATRMIGILEHLQVPLAVAREELGIEGLGVEAALNFRDKSRMKTALRAAGLPCARHALAGDRGTAEAFAAEVGYPLVVKPPAGAGSKGTFRLDSDDDLQAFLRRYPPDPARPALLEEFVRGAEHSFDSVVVEGERVWHSVSRYLPSPLEVMENDWIQWSVLLPRDITGPEFDPIREAGFRAVEALGLETGLSHMEWFALEGGRIAISEVGARPPGAQITSLLSWAHDVDFYHLWPRLMITGEFQAPQRRFAAGAAYVRGMGTGRVRRIGGLDEAQRRFGHLVVEARLPRAGQPRADGYEGEGFVIIRHPETAVVEEALREIVRLVRVELA